MTLNPHGAATAPDGHRTVSQSARYAHIRNDVLREASEAASTAFRKARMATNQSEEAVA